MNCMYTIEGDYFCSDKNIEPFAVARAGAAGAAKTPEDKAAKDKAAKDKAAAAKVAAAKVADYSGQAMKVNDGGSTVNRSGPVMYNTDNSAYVGGANTQFSSSKNDGVSNKVNTLTTGQLMHQGTNMQIEGTSNLVCHLNKNIAENGTYHFTEKYKEKCPYGLITQGNPKNPNDISCFCEE